MKKLDTHHRLKFWELFEYADRDEIEAYIESLIDLYYKVGQRDGLRFANRKLQKLFDIS